MRNLRNIHRSLIEGSKKGVCTWDVVDQGSVICAFGPSADDTLIQLKRWRKYEDSWDLIASWDAPCPLPELAHDYVVNLRYLSDISTHVLVLAGGDMIVVRESPTALEDKIEIVGSVDVGISAAAWSPDEELLLIVTNASTALYMTRGFENVVDLKLSGEDFKISNHVSVGWGKKETQFKGKKARALRDPTVPETVDEGTLHPRDNSEVRISWRGDGAYVAINSVQDSRRVIRVLSREGEMDSVSEPVDNMMGALSWRPAGNLIAAIQRRQQDVKVIFFERNGLRHGDFDLRLTEEEMSSWAAHVELEWNLDSSVLAVRFQDRIQLWTMGNYHWYLKQSIASPNNTDYCWHPEKPLHFALCDNFIVQRFAYAFVVPTCPTSPPHDHGLTAVIDGNKVKLTPLKRANIPPPMSLEDIVVSETVTDVAVLSSESESTMHIAVLHGMTVSQFSWAFPSKPSLDKEWTVSKEGPDHAYQMALQINPGLNGEVSVHSNGLASKAHQDMLIKISQSGIDFHLDEHGSLWANERRLASGCTSFLVTREHLLFTSKSLLKFVHLIGEVEGLQVPPDTPESDERCRSIERGARLVAVMPSIFAVVLQMPRGNLETIYPRALILAGIRDNVNQMNYRKAFLACRNHRVDMNILYDHAPHQLLKNVALFVDKVKRPDYIDLFLSQLRDEDVTRTMYKETLRPLDDHDKLANTLPNGSKVNRVCDAFITELRDRPPEYLQNVLAAYVCKTPPDLDAALLEIARLRRDRSAHVESMIEHICFLADVNRLYDHALGLYDLELTLLIAQKSQRDPKEYLPFLRNLHQMPQLRRQFSIDDHLKRHVKAVIHICKLEVFEEVKTYVKRHSLYTRAMDYYRYDEERLREVIAIYAHFLQQEGKFRDAGVAFESISDHVAASESFRQAHLWQESLSNATQAGTEPQQVTALATSLSDALVETRDYASAGRIKLEYLADTPAAARLFCKGYHFAEAIRIVGLYQRHDLLESVIDLGLQDGMGTMIDLLADCKGQLNAQIPRIKELRVKKAEDPLAFWEGDAPGVGEIPDDISIAPTDASTTGGSLFTRYTNRTGTVGTNATRRTSKNKRREERKRARGKKGSVYEEEYLVNSVERLIQRIDSIHEEVSRLVTGLARRNMREQAKNVELAMAEITEMWRGGMKEIFQDSTTAEQAEEAVQSLPDAGKLPSIRDFEKLSLLGG